MAGWTKTLHFSLFAPAILLLLLYGLLDEKLACVFSAISIFVLQPMVVKVQTPAFVERERSGSIRFSRIVAQATTNELPGTGVNLFVGVG